MSADSGGVMDVKLCGIISSGLHSWLDDKPLANGCTFVMLVSQHQFFLSKISFILWTGQNSQVIRSSLIVSRQRDDTCAVFITVRKTEEIENVWPQGNL